MVIAPRGLARLVSLETTRLVAGKVVVQSSSGGPALTVTLHYPFE